MSIRYTAVHKGVSTVGEEAFKDYKEYSEIRNKKELSYYADYRRLARKLWKKVADASIEYESGVYDSQFFYIIPQVIDNKPFIQVPRGKIKTNMHTGGDIYTPIFCNILRLKNHYCWSLDGSFVDGYKKKLQAFIDEHVPKYYFILDTLKKNKF